MILPRPYSHVVLPSAVNKDNQLTSLELINSNCSPAGVILFQFQSLFRIAYPFRRRKLRVSRCATNIAIVILGM